MARSTRTTMFRFWLWLIALIGVIVPRRLRDDWKQEWEAELQHREHLLDEWDRLAWRTKLDLLLRSVGAFWDALWLQSYRWEDEMIQDLRYGVRMLLKKPGFTITAVLSLAIGIGANSAIFSVVNGVVLRPLPFHEPERLVRLWHDKPQANQHEILIAPDDVIEWRNQAQSFDGIAAYFQTGSVFTGDFEPEQVAGARVSADYFPLLGFQPILGRNFLSEETQPGKDLVLLLSHQLWQRRFGADPAIIGRTITMDHTNSYTVVGVMPPDVSFPGKSEFWKPLDLHIQVRHGMRYLSVIARLKPGATFKQAAAELNLANEGLQQQYPEAYKGSRIEILPLHDSVVGKVRLALMVLLGAVGFVLLIACANVANLLLARAAARQKEIAVRAALGAGRWRLIRQMLTESTLLAALGGACGLLLARWGVQALIALNPPNIPRLNQVSIDGRVLGFTFAVSLLVGLLFGLAPALQLSKPDLNRALKEGGAQAASSGQRFRGNGLRGLLVVAQTALALVLLAGAGLMLKSFVKLRQVELGFDPTHAIELTIAPAFNRFPQGQRTNDYYQQMLDSINTTSGVISSAVVTGAPLGGFLMTSPILIAGRPAPASTDAQPAHVTVISPDYFRVVGTALKQGRFFTEHDGESKPRVAIINEAMARRYFPDGSPIGQRISLISEQDKPFEIVGVVADIKQIGLDKETQPNLYLSFRQYEVGFMNIVARSVGEPSTLIPALRSRIREVDQYAPITRVRTLEEVVSESIAQPRFYTLLLALFAGVAVILAAIGLYGVMSYAVSQRTREIGIRVALGAEPQRILRMIVGQGLLLILMGVAAGLAAAFALTRLISTLLFGVSATDPVTFAVIALTLIVVALAACYLPARRATKVDPMTALRCE
ncbi:MAG: ABC transporter permease [Acidobacteriota bacterium]